MMGDVAGYWVGTPLSPLEVHARWQVVTGFIHSGRSYNLIRAKLLQFHCERKQRLNSIIQYQYYSINIVWSLI